MLLGVLQSRKALRCFWLGSGDLW